MEYSRKISDDNLLLEGYGDTIKVYLPNIPSNNPVVPIHGVGGCVLMIKADCHRQGLIFPTFVFKHHIETEGLAKMAARMGIGVFGMPNLYIIHW